MQTRIIGPVLAVLHVPLDAGERLLSGEASAGGVLAGQFIGKVFQ